MEELKLAEIYMEKMVELDRKGSTSFGVLRKHPERIDEIIEDATNPLKSTSYTQDQVESQIYSLLDKKFEMLEKTGGDSSNAYRKDATAQEFAILRHRLSEYEDRTRDEIELISILRHLGEENGAVEMRDLREIDGFPSPTSYYNKFGGWNNALWSAGLETNQEEWDPEAIEECVRKKWDEIGQIPRAEDLYRDNRMPSREPVRTHFETYNQLLEEALSMEIRRDHMGHLVSSLPEDYLKWVDTTNSREDHPYRADSGFHQTATETTLGYGGTTAD